MTSQDKKSNLEIFSDSKKRIINNLEFSFTKLVKPFFKNKNPKKLGAMLFYPAPDFGSLGDQAMYISATEQLRNIGYEHITLITPSYPTKLDLPISPNSLINPNSYFDGSTYKSLKFIKSFCSNDALFIIGADIMDGYYSEINSLKRIHLLDKASTLGIPARVLGFSFNENPSRIVVDAMKKLPLDVQLLARDPVSQRRLENALNRPIRLVADLAFLLPSNAAGHSAVSTIDWIKEKKSKNARIIGINSNFLLSKGNFDDPLTIATGLAKTIIELHNQHSNLHFVMISHDSRHSLNDEILNKIVREILVFNNSSLREKIFLMPTPCSAAEIKAVSQFIDFAITGRMHFAIACLGQGTPALCIGYQGKMEGLYEHFDIKDMVISPIEAFQSNELVKRTNLHLLNLDELKNHINKKLSHIINLSKQNFD